MDWARGSRGSLLPDLPAAQRTDEGGRLPLLPLSVKVTAQAWLASGVVSGPLPAQRSSAR